MRKATRIFLKILVSVFIVLAVVAIALQIIGSAYVKPLVAKKLEKLVVNGSDSLYRLHYRSMDVNLWTGSIGINNMRVYPDSTRFYQLKQADNLPPITMDFSLEKGAVQGFDVLMFALSKKVKIGSIQTKDANISLSRHFYNNRPKRNTEPKPLWKLIQPDLQTISVGELVLDNIRLSYTNRDSGTAFQWAFERFDTKVTDIMIDSASAMNTERLLYAGNIETNIYKISLYSADSLYQLKAGQISYSLKNKSSEILDLELQPTLSKKAFYKKTRMEKDIYTVKVPSIRLTHFTPEMFLTDNVLKADSLFISDVQLQIYRDRVPPDDMVSKLGKSPHQLLLNAPFYIRVNYAFGKNISVNYTEKDDRTLQEGKLWFKRIHGEAFHISNHPDDIALHPFCDVKVSGVFMKDTRIRGGFKFDLTKTDGSFEAEAHISPTDITVLNPLVEALGSVRFKSLQTGEAYYKIKGNEHVAYGYLKMPYTNLEMQVLHLPENGKEGSHKKFISWVIKKISHDSNPGKNGELRIANNIRYERNKYRSFFNLIWKTMFTAAKDVAMRESMKKVEEKRQKKIRKKSS